MLRSGMALTLLLALAAFSGEVPSGSAQRSSATDKDLDTGSPSRHSSFGDTVVAVINQQNAPSIRGAKRLGLRLDRVIPYDGVPSGVYVVG